MRNGLTSPYEIIRTLVGKAPQEFLDDTGTVKADEIVRALVPSTDASTAGAKTSAARKSWRFLIKN